MLPPGTPQWVMVEIGLPAEAFWKADIDGSEHLLPRQRPIAGVILFLVRYVGRMLMARTGRKPPRKDSSPALLPISAAWPLVTCWLGLGHLCPTCRGGIGGTCGSHRPNAYGHEQTGEFSPLRLVTRTLDTGGVGRRVEGEGLQQILHA